MGLLYFVGIVLLAAGIAAAVGLLVGGLFNLNVTVSSRHTLWAMYWAGTVIGILLVIWSGLMLGWFVSLQILNVTGIILVLLGVAAAVGLVVGAVFNLQVSREARRTLWWVFWGTLSVGIFLVYGLPPLLRTLGVA
jgi:hypothetical protein